MITTSQMAKVFPNSVRDSKAGILEDIRSKIFDPFFTTKPVGKGTGLGLVICYGSVQDHGGLIAIYSAEAPGRSSL